MCHISQKSSPCYAVLITVACIVTITQALSWSLTQPISASFALCQQISPLVEMTSKTCHLPKESLFYSQFYNLCVILTLHPTD